MPKIRLNKYLANSGIASRRKAEELILAGKIKVNGKIISELGTSIEPNKDKVLYQNNEVKQSVDQKTLIAFNKPKGVVSTTRKFEGEKNVLDYVKADERLVIIGRLDKDSQGLILLTNDYDLVNKIEHPKFGIEKEYLVEVSKPIKQEEVDKLIKGMEIEDYFAKAKKVKKINKKLLKIILTEGKKRQIRKMLESINFKVVSLKRIRIDKYKLGDIKEGGYARIKF